MKRNTLDSTAFSSPKFLKCQKFKMLIWLWWGKHKNESTSETQICMAQFYIELEQNFDLIVWLWKIYLLSPCSQYHEGIFKAEFVQRTLGKEWHTSLDLLLRRRPKPSISWSNMVAASASERSCLGLLEPSLKDDQGLKHIKCQHSSL